MSLQHTLPACAATDPPWRQSISLAANLWEIACRHGLGQSTRNEYRGQLAELLARYPALAGRTAAVSAPAAAAATTVGAAATTATAPTQSGAPRAPAAAGAGGATASAAAPGGRPQRGAQR